jgi:hypothetical protein
MASTQYFDHVIAARSIASATNDQEAATEGSTTISLETCEMGEADIFTWIESNFSEFMRALKRLPPGDREILLSYYLIGKPQHAIARISRTTQTLMSSKIRDAMKRLCAVLLLGDITETLLADIFTGAGVEHQLSTPLSVIAWSYSRTRAFSASAKALKLKRPDIRRALVAAHKILIASDDTREQALGAWLYGLLEKSNPTGKGLSAREKKKQGDQYHVNSRILGEFVVDVTDPDFKLLFASRAER